MLEEGLVPDAHVVLRIVGDWLIFYSHTYSNWGEQKPARSSEFIELPNFTPDDVIRPINLPTTQTTDKGGY